MPVCNGNSLKGTSSTGRGKLPELRFLMLFLDLLCVCLGSMRYRQGRAPARNPACRS